MHTHTCKSAICQKYQGVSLATAQKGGEIWSWLYTSTPRMNFESDILVEILKIVGAHEPTMLKTLVLRNCSLSIILYRSHMVCLCLSVCYDALTPTVFA